MKKIIFICLMIFNSAISSSQSGWFQTNSPVTGLTLLNIQFTSSGTGYAVGFNNGYQSGEIQKTTNAGLNWQRIIFDTVSLSDIYFNDDNTGYLIGDKESIGKGYIYKTTNGGISWILQYSTTANGFFKVKFFDYNTGFVAGKYSQVLKTTNGGINWISKSGANLMEPTAIWYFDANNWIITDNTGKFNKTTNGGDNWITYDFYNTGISLNSICFFNSSTGIETSVNGEIYKTTNSGANWFRLDSLPCYLYGITFTNENSGYVCGGGPAGSIYKTTNGGYNWTLQPLSPNVWFAAISFINNLTGYVTEEGGSRIFKTTNGGAVFIKNISGELPSNYYLYQNYPNPFNPVTKIKFDVPVDDPKGTPRIRGNDKVVLKVYNILGKEIATLVNEKLQPGSYEVTFNGDNLPSGMYFYKISAGECIETRKMILIK
jgi:photosystem II stability/assembly factor-like uncharacterized protein